MGSEQSKSTTRTEKDGTTTIEFEWPLKDIPKLPTYDVGQSIDKSISASGSNKYTFSIFLYPHGFNERSKNYVSVWLKKQTDEEISVRFTCSITDCIGKRLCIKEIKQNLALESAIGWPTFCSRYILLADGDNALNGSTLTLKGKIEIFGSNAIANAENEDNPVYERSLSELSYNFQQLLEDRQFSDFAIKVGHKTLRVHKAVLSARSAVFKSMLKSSLHQNLKDITILDISSEGVEMMLKYIYTGKLDNLSIQTALDVYYAADKYEVLMLRNICSVLLSKNLLPDNVIKILLLAYRHSDLELQEACLSFMDKNLHEIKGRSEWIDLMRNFPDLADKSLLFSRN